MQMSSQPKPTRSAAAGELAAWPARGTSPRLTFAGAPFHQACESVVSPCRFARLAKREDYVMRTLRRLLVPAAALMLTFPLALSAHAQQPKVTIGKVIGGDGFHVPTYIALDQGFFKAEGLDGSLLELDPRSQVTGVISGNLDCAPIPSGGAQAALSGAKIMYIVGESLKSQWTITSRQEINKPEDLRGKVLGYGRQGGADYDEAQAVLHRFFHMDVGKDYKVISFQGEPERIAAMSNDDIQGASLSIPHAAVAEQAGLKVLLRTGDYIPRAGGTIWCSADFVQKNPETVKKIVRAIAKSVMYFRTNKEGSIAVLRHHIGSIKTDEEAGLIWDQLHNTFGAEVPKDLFREIFESRRLTMIAARQWPEDKPLPDPEGFLARDLLDPTLKEMGYVPTNIEAPAKGN
jgi:ABC-type nitrate/sulfonate/bicarbonate transport system substrate-binding protein